MTISDITLKFLCERYRSDIGMGNIRLLPRIKVRYVIGKNKFGYTCFGNFFFFGEDFYVWENDEKYAEEHNQDVVLDVFGDKCEGRGYAHKVIFAGVLTGYYDSNGENVYTGDVIKIEKDDEPTHVLALGAWSREDGDGEYCFILDNHNWALDECVNQHYQFTRVGTVFYQLDVNNSVDVNLRVMWFNGWMDTEEKRQMKENMAQYTPNFDKELWKYSALELLGVEFDWR